MLDPFEAFFANYSPDVQTISRTLRTMVKSTMPQANEILYAHHNHIGYSFTESMGDRICYICPMKDYLRLGFMFGTHLTDPDHMLEGTDKRLRHTKIRTLKDASHPALKHLIEAAWADALTHMKRNLNINTKNYRAKCSLNAPNTEHEDIAGENHHGTEQP